MPEYWIIHPDSDQIDYFSKPQGESYTETRVFGPGAQVWLLGKKFAVNELLILPRRNRTYTCSLWRLL
ncbi:hypothetical protein [Cyclobacterium xiamenense]|uniref:hypothetical protein n=1 Tax=Cyclobacterium xiamenense TaxID=1297121 RepID=UPI0035D0CF17